MFQGRWNEKKGIDYRLTYCCSVAEFAQLWHDGPRGSRCWGNTLPPSCSRPSLTLLLQVVLKSSMSPWGACQNALWGPVSYQCPRRGSGHWSRSSSDLRHNLSLSLSTYPVVECATALRLDSHQVLNRKDPSFHTGASGLSLRLTQRQNITHASHHKPHPAQRSAQEPPRLIAVMQTIRTSKDSS